MNNGCSTSRTYDVAVVGGGHAGIEACLAAARLGCRVLLVTHKLAEIGRMPCNPAIGGLGKGHLVRELDVLGGQMGLAIDAAGIQFRLLNRSKGPAVRSPRAQADKASYQRYMIETVLGQETLTVKEGEVTGLLTESREKGGKRIIGVRCSDGNKYECRRAVLSSGTFLRGLMHLGEKKITGGREGAASAEGLSGDLARLGFELRRLKTGTSPRLARGSIDFSALEAQAGDEHPRPFSFRTGEFHPHQLMCHLAYTNKRTHRQIEESLHRSPLYAGIIEGTGPRYCPSIEDKVVRFADKGRHLLFLEPEGRDSEEIYVNGLSTSLPADVQEKIVHSVRGLEEAELVRYGYAVEYDSIPSCQVMHTLESGMVDGLFLAGQILGTSGYEEAAAQGFVAGLNAVFSLRNQPPFISGRSESYIGVLIDDIVTKEISEPYRMFTSRAEFRLSLRCDNVETRLLGQAERLGVLRPEELSLLRRRARGAEKVRNRLHGFRVTVPGEIDRPPAGELLRRPEVDLESLFRDCPEGESLREALQGELDGREPESGGECAARFAGDVFSQAETDIKYAGYIAKQERILASQKHLDNLEVPEDIDYAGIEALSFESREKLARIRPVTLGQASRIDGVRAGDLAVLTVYLKKLRAQGSEGRPGYTGDPARKRETREP